MFKRHIAWCDRVGIGLALFLSPFLLLIFLFGKEPGLGIGLIIVAIFLWMVARLIDFILGGPWHRHHS